MCQRILEGKILEGFWKILEDSGGFWKGRFIGVITASANVFIGRFLNTIPEVDFLISLSVTLILISHSDRVFRKSIHTYHIKL